MHFRLSRISRHWIWLRFPIKFECNLNSHAFCWNDHFRGLPSSTENNRPKTMVCNQNTRIIIIVSLSKNNAENSHGILFHSPYNYQSALNTTIFYEKRNYYFNLPKISISIWLIPFKFILFVAFSSVYNQSTNHLNCNRLWWNNQYIRDINRIIILWL